MSEAVEVLEIRCARIQEKTGRCCGHLLGTLVRSPDGTIQWARPVPLAATTAALEQGRKLRWTLACSKQRCGASATIRDQDRLFQGAKFVDGRATVYL